MKTIRYIKIFSLALVIFSCLSVSVYAAPISAAAAPDVSGLLSQSNEISKLPPGLDTTNLYYYVANQNRFYLEKDNSIKWDLGQL
ncbi:hypothetical protein, partial [Paenibacillus sp. NAIST15-1]|uniref:hypothetical protein n=1 Tax=Paenibacillus sp. NAIST15-1 TaxID=1605994 RepID=UPI001D12F960